MGHARCPRGSGVLRCIQNTSRAAHKMPPRPTRPARPTFRGQRESAPRQGPFAPRARASTSSLPGRSFGVAKPPRRPRHLTLRPGKKSYQLALDVSSRRAADRSPTEQDGRRAESIGINSNMTRDNTQAVGTTPGRPIWLGCHGLTVGVAKRPDCLQENGQCGRPVGRTRVV